LIQEGIAIGEKKGKAEGIAIGEQKGIEIAKKVLLALVEVKFGPVTVDVKERIQAASDADLDAWTQRVLLVSTVDEIFLDKKQFS
jgi:hypothetical protein